MAIRTREIVNGVMGYLDYPSPKMLSRSVVYDRLQDKIDGYRARLNLSAQDWLMERWPFTIPPNTDDINVITTAGAVPNVGRWVIVFTDDLTGDPNFVRREVPVVGIQDIQRYYEGTRLDVGGGVSSPWVARCFNFWAEGNNIKCRVTPQHSVSANYVAFYEPDRPLPPRLNQNWPLLNGFINVVKVDLAITCLPNLAVKEPKTGEIQNQQYLNFKLGILQRDYTNYNATFEEYRSQAVQDHVGPRLGWGYGEDMYGDSGYGWWG